MLDSFDLIGDNAELVEIADNVYMRPKTYTFPIDDPDKEFIPPVGIVKSVFEGEYEYDLIKENFVAFGADENGIFEFELVLEKENLIDTFIKTIQFVFCTQQDCFHRCERSFHLQKAISKGMG